MRMTRRTLLSSLAAAGALPLAAADLPREATPLTLRTLDGRSISLESLEGKAVAVLFFSTDCPHCQRTAELLGPMYEEFGPKGLEILGCAVNPSASGNLNQFRSNHNVEFPLGLVTRSTWTTFTDMPATARAYVPHIVFVDRQGRVIEDHPGVDRLFWVKQEENFRRAFEKMTSEPSS